MLSLERTTSENSDFKNLVVLLDAHLKILDGDDHEFYAQLNTFESTVDAIICYQNGQAVGCGAFKIYNQTTIEIKRMYVLPEYRGKGIASIIVNELEVWATQLQFSKAILETGYKQLDAIALYEKLGYHRMHNYGQYEGVSTSICMDKILQQ